MEKQDSNTETKHRIMSQEAFEMFRAVMSLIASVCQSPLDAYYCILRVSGLSMDAIGKLDHNKSRAAVHKRLHKICQREPLLRDYLCNYYRKGANDGNTVRVISNGFH